MKVGWFVCYTFGFPPFEFVEGDGCRGLDTEDPAEVLVDEVWERKIMEMVDNKVEDEVIDMSTRQRRWRNPFYEKTRTKLKSSEIIPIDMKGALSHPLTMSPLQ